MERIPLIIDTDMAFGSPCADIDDAVALLFAFSSPELCVKAVSAAGGNAPPDRVSRNIERNEMVIFLHIHSFMMFCR